MQYKHFIGTLHFAPKSKFNLPYMIVWLIHQLVVCTNLFQPKWCKLVILYFLVCELDCLRVSKQIRMCIAQETQLNQEVRSS